MTDQLILNFPIVKNYLKEDFYVSSSNKEAYDYIISWPKWVKRIVNIFGPPGSGKTHISSILNSKTSKHIKNVALKICSYFSIYMQAFLIHTFY